jgi:hypothetical protein
VSAKPKTLEELTRQVVRGEGQFAQAAPAADGTRRVDRDAGREAALAVMASPPNPDTSLDVFDRPLGRLVGEAGLRAQANHSRDAVEQKDARLALAERKAKTRAAAPARPGQRPSVAQWTNHVRERLSRMSEEQRHELVWNSEWYHGLSERAASIVDQLLLEFGEEETRVDEAAAIRTANLLGETEARRALDAELDEEYAFGDEYLPGTPEYELEAEMEEADVGYTFEEGDAA